LIDSTISLFIYMRFLSTKLPNDTGSKLPWPPIIMSLCDDVCHGSGKELEISMHSIFLTMSLYSQAVGSNKINFMSKRFFGSTLCCRINLDLIRRIAYKIRYMKQGVVFKHDSYFQSSFLLLVLRSLAGRVAYSMFSCP